MTSATSSSEAVQRRRIDAGTLLTDRIEALRERLKLAQALVGGAPGFVAAIAAKAKDVDELAGAPAGEFAWPTLAAREDGLKGLFREVLALLQGENRPAFPDASAVVLARSLVAELAGKFPVGAAPAVVPDVDDSFSDFVELIRLRFPAVGVWDVPVVAHEFGHFVAYRLTSWEDGLQRSQAVRTFITNYLGLRNIKHENEQKRWRQWLNEFFADAFATYCMGPCYVSSALLLRFEVSQAHKESTTHPSAAARAAAILETLSEMNRDLSCMYRVAIRALESQWSGLEKFAEPDAERICPIEDAKEVARQLYPVLSNIARSARYETWDNADALQYVLTKPDKRPEGPLSARDLLNAAWLARSRGCDAATVSARTLELWQSRAAGVKRG